MYNDDARRLLYEWQGGQRSALYAAASSGLIEDMGALAGEITCCMNIAHGCGNMRELQDLKDLRKFCEFKVRGPIEINGEVYLALPWYEEKAE